MTRIQQHTSAHALSTEDRSTGRIAGIGLLVVIALLALSVGILNAQAPSSRGSIRPFVGAYIPTGDQRDFLKDAVLVGAQASWNIHPNAGLTATFGWAPSKDKVSVNDQTIDAYQFDLGLEGRAPDALADGFTPFLGAGIGSRTYNYRDLNLDSKSNVAGYGALGFDLAVGPVGVRVEGRDYVSQFKPLSGSGKNETRNDVAVLAGVGFRF